MAQLAQAFSGTYVSDANVANLATGATLNAAGSTNGTAVQVDRPHEVGVVVETGTVTGTTPTITVVIQASDDSGFSTGVVEVATVTGSGGSQSNQRWMANAYINKKYVRAAVTLAGTSPVYTGTTIRLQSPHYFRTSTTSA